MLQPRLDRLVVAISLLQAILPLALSACPSGWESYKGFCYYYSTAKFNFNEALSSCKSRKGNLVSFRDLDQYKYVQSTLTRVNSGQHYWTGLSDTKKERTYVFDDGTAYARNNVIWNTRQPVADNNKDCAFMQTNTNPKYKLSMYNCRSAFRYVCKRSENVRDPCDTGAGWHVVGSRCYKFYTERLNWFNARASCQADGADLITVGSAAEKSFVGETIACQGSTQNVMWLGYSDTVKSTFAWVDKSNPARTFMNWDSGQPKQGTPKGDSCGIVFSYNQYKWRIESCSNNERRYICEKPQGSCPKDWKAGADGMCYLIKTQATTWVDAWKTCESYGSTGSLIAFENGEASNRNTVPGNLLKQLGNAAIWVGVSDRNTRGTFQKVDNQLPKASTWSKGATPPAARGRMSCGSMSASDATGKWESTYCFKFLRYICQMKMSDSLTAVTTPDYGNMGCLKDWVFYPKNRMCYRFMSDKKNYQQAKDDCVSQQGNLADVPDMYVQSFLSINLKGSSLIAATDGVKNGEFLDSSGAKLTFTNWNNNEPNGGTRENCVEILQGSNKGAWNDLQCTTARNYICQKSPTPGGTTPAPIIPPTPAYSPLCGTGWTFDAVSGRCYYLSSDQKNWADARKQCLKMNADLLSLGGPPEQRFIQGILSQKVGVLQYWIGASDRSAEGGWEWSDGSPFKYLNWNAGEPNDLNDEDCVELSNLAQGRWNDARCGTSYNYICKKRGALPQAELTTTPSTGVIQAGQNCSGYALISGEHWVSDSHMMGIKAADGKSDPNSGPANARIDWDVYSSTPTSSVSTSVQYSYIPVPNLDLRTVTSVTFTVQACNDAHITLQPSLGSIDKSSYEIVIGGWGNTKSVIRKQHQRDQVQQATTPTILDCGNPRPFWLSWAGNTIAVGKGRAVGQNRVMSVVEDKSLTVHSVAVSTGWQSTGKWVFTNPKGARKGGWVPSSPKDRFQVNFDKPVVVQRIATRGQSDSSAWIVRYTLQFKYDGVTPWQPYRDPGSDSVKVFTGNTDQGSLVSNTLLNPISAKMFRVVPVEVHGTGGMRIEMYGCVSPVYCTPEAMISGPSSIRPTQLSASSSSPNQLASAGRFLGYRGAAEPSGWQSSGGSKQNDQVGYEWLQADFGQDIIVYGVQTKGAKDTSAWVTKYILAFRQNSASELSYYQEPFGTVRVFDGNNDQNTVVTNSLGVPIMARYLQVIPIKGNGQVTDPFGLRLEVLGCAAECTAVALIDGPQPIDDSMLKASSSVDDNSGPGRARFSSTRQGSFFGAWRAGSGANSWIQVNFGTNQRVEAVSTKGRSDADEWVTQYILALSADGKNFWRYKNGMKFDGNWDRNTEVKYYYKPNIAAQIVRLIVVQYNGKPSMRMEVFGCDAPAVREKGCFFKPLTTASYSLIATYNPYACSRRCYDSGYAYSGIRFRNCYCLANMPITGKSSVCDIKCGALSKLKCGGRSGNALSVYTTGRRADDARCASGYTEFNEKCYKLNTAAKSWQNAQQECRLDGGDLVTINDLAVQSFVKSMVAKANLTTNPWIGLNDIRVQMNFAWSDHTPVLATYWYKNEPNNWMGSEEDCVQMVKDHGLWNDESCSTQSAFICQKIKQKPDPDEIITPPPPVRGCDQGWTAYGSNCFLFHEQYVTWSLAKSICQKEGGHLVRIRDEYQQAFLTSQLYSRSQSQQTGNYYWTDLRSFDGQTFVYSSRYQTLVPYTHWDQGQPVVTYGKRGAAVLIPPKRARSSNVGYWLIRSMDSGANLVCEKARVGFKQQPFPTLSPTSIDCSVAPGWVGVGSWCYQVNAVNVQQRKTWVEAEADCKAKGAHLAYVVNKTENDDLWRLKVLGSQGNFWIGLNDREVKDGFVWASAESATFLNWEDGEPNDWQDDVHTSGGEEACVEMLTATGTWNDKRCLTANNWICSIPRSKVNDIKIPTTTIAPTSGDPSMCAQDGSNWSYFGKKCYYLNKTPKTWHAARDTCLGQGGDLVSIGNVNEQNYVASLAIHAFDSPDGSNAWLKGGSQVQVWIGLNEMAASNGHRWSDGNPFTFTRWEPNEPNDWDGGEYCVGMRARTGEWNDIHCSALFGFVCEKYVNRTTGKPPQPTIPVSGFCPAGYKEFKNDCYKMSLSSNKDIDWRQAETLCEADNSTLASILDQQEQDFLSSQLIDAQDVYKTAVWIGMKNLNAGVQSGKAFAWDDNRPVTFTNWNRGEPNGLINEPCVEMLARPMGVWNDISCDHKLGGYVCKKRKSGQDFVRPSTTPSPSCPSTPAGSPSYIPYGQSCFKLVNQATLQSMAASECAKDGAYLATISSRYELAFVSSLLRQQNYFDNRQVWIGLKSTSSVELFKWADNWPVTVTNWAQGEPAKVLGEQACVQMHPFTGEWSHQPCSSMNFYLCRSTNALPQYTPPANGSCPSMRGETWTAFNGYCYYFSDKGKGFTQPESLAQCKGRSADLVSIHSVDETNFLHTQMENKYIDAVWTGLVKKSNGGYAWEDGSALQFALWAPGEPNSVQSSADGERCVESRQNGQWNDLSCDSPIGFVCKIRQGDVPKTDTNYIPMPTTSTTTAVATTAPLCWGSEWSYFNSRCYLPVLDTPLNFQEASDNCQVRGGSLVTISDSNVQKFIEDTILPRMPRLENAWIGISEKLSDNRFLWEDRSFSRYRNWDPSTKEPNTNFGSMDCGVILNDAQNSNFGKWATRYCYNKKAFICMIDNHVKPRDLVDVSVTNGDLCYFPFVYHGQSFDSCTSFGASYLWCSRVPDYDKDGGDNNFLLCNPVQCDPGWIEAGQKCYYFSKEYKSWADSAAYCEGQGGHLVNISGTTEQGFVSDYIDDFYWIGLNDIQQARRFMWRISSTVSVPYRFTNWAPGEPRSVWGNEDCALAKGGDYDNNWPGSWVMEDCNAKRKFVCIKLGVFPDVTTPTTPTLPPTSGPRIPSTSTVIIPTSGGRVGEAADTGNNNAAMAQETIIATVFAVVGCLLAVVFICLFIHTRMTTSAKSSSNAIMEGFENATYTADDGAVVLRAGDM